MLFWGLSIDPLYIVRSPDTLVISGAAQLFMRSQFGMNSALPNNAGLPDPQVSQIIVGNVDFRGSRGSDVAAAVKSVLTLLYDHSIGRR